MLRAECFWAHPCTQGCVFPGAAADLVTPCALGPLRPYGPQDLPAILSTVHPRGQEPWESSSLQAQQGEGWGLLAPGTPSELALSTGSRKSFPPQLQFCKQQ